MLQRAHQYIAVEALVAGKRDESKRPRVEQHRGHPSGPTKRREDRSNILPSRPPPIPLNSTRIEILLQIRERGLLKTPNPMKTCFKIRDERRLEKGLRMKKTSTSPSGWGIKSTLTMTYSDGVVHGDQFQRCIITKVPRSENSQKNALARLTSSHGTSPQPWGIARIPEPSISLVAMSIAEEGES
ncbi:hypothetical protein B296_00010773 [Ensete ventricosum]|uniref:Uncharacterized protein n=1 Tax=Ensete ventricosum TaxID=4639 RepID=A0A426ZP40_ENSVE|nr:hypothetical protein B296_00010773 [Ensete ventricosum]